MKRIIVVVSVASLLLVAAISGCTEGSAHECGDRAERWQSALERWDANKDGQISKDEFQGPDRLFERLDANSDGVLTEAEAQEVPGWLREGEGRMRAGHADPAERWKGMLERWDANKDGQISKEEFQGSDNAFDRLDANSDGVLTEAEAQETAGRLGPGGSARGYVKASPEAKAIWNQITRLQTQERARMWELFELRTQEADEEQLKAKAEELRAIHEQIREQREKLAEHWVGAPPGERGGYRGGGPGQHRHQGPPPPANVDT